MPDYLVNDPATGKRLIETARNATEAMQNYSDYATARLINPDGTPAAPVQLMSNEEAEWNEAFNNRWSS